MARQTWTDAGIELPSGASGNVHVRCPECTPRRRPENQRKRDLSVNVEQGIWLCQHCGWKGSLDSRPSDGTPAYGDRLAPQHRTVIAPDRTYEAPRPLPSVTVPTLWDNAIRYFAERGIPESVVAEKGITASNEYCPVCQGEVGTILFPYVVDGRHVNTKHRCGRKHFRMERGAQRVLYNLDACAAAERIVIVEGEFDALAVHTAGVSDVVSVPDGAPAANASNYSSKFSFLEAAESLFARVREVVIATDADEPGLKLMDELARRIGPERCARVLWPDGIKDANECLLRDGAEALRQRIERAQPFPVAGIHTGYDLLPDLEALYDNGTDPGVGFGYRYLDQHYRVKTGYMSVVTGIPSHGKSSAIDQLLVRLADRHDWTFAVFSPEQQPLTLHQRQLLEIWTGKPFSEGHTTRMTRDEMRAANTWVADRFAFILPDSMSIDAILDLARIQVFRNGIRGLVVDPWNELEHARPRHLSETEYISEALSKFRRFARNHNVHVWVIAHPTKMRRTDDGDEPVPTLWDIAGSAHFRNKADIGITVWRDIAQNNNLVQIHITKMRFADSGKLGKVEFLYESVSKRLIELREVA